VSVTVSRHKYKATAVTDVNSYICGFSGVIHQTVFHKWLIKNLMFHSANLIYLKECFDIVESLSCSELERMRSCLQWHAGLWHVQHAEQHSRALHKELPCVPLVHRLPKLLLHLHKCLFTKDSWTRTATSALHTFLWYFWTKMFFFCVILAGLNACFLIY